MKNAMHMILEREYNNLSANKNQNRKDLPSILQTEHDFSVSPDLAMVLHFLPSWLDLPIPNIRPMPRHCHDCFELIYVESGNFHNAVEDQNFVLDTSKVVLIPPGYFHAPYIRSDSDRVINLLIRPQLMERCLYFFGDNYLELSPFFYEYIYGLPVSMKYLLLKKTEDIQQIMTKMVQLYSCFDRALAPQLLANFTELLTAMADSYRIHSTGAFEKVSTVSEIIIYIRAHYLTVTRKELCETFHYSPSHLSSLIKAETGKTFKELIQDYKLESAKNLLATTSISIEKISEILNFQDTYYLSRIFKKKYGVTPSCFRNQCIENHY